MLIPTDIVHIIGSGFLMHHEINRCYTRQHYDDRIDNHPKTTAFPFLWCQIPHFWNFQNTQNNSRRHEYEIGIDDEQVSCPKEHVPSSVCNGISAGT